MSISDEVSSILDFAFEDSDDEDRRDISTDDLNISKMDNVDETFEFKNHIVEEEEANHVTKKSSRLEMLTKISSDGSIAGDARVFIEIPGIMINLFNIGNLKELNSVITNFFTENCSIQSTAMAFEEFGRDRVMKLFLTVSQTVPDIFFLLKKVEFDKELGIVTARIGTTGTKQFTDHLDYMYDVARYGPSDKIDPGLRQKAIDIENAGGRYRFFSKSKWILTLNADLTKIKKMVVVQHLFQITEAPHIG